MFFISVFLLDLIIYIFVQLLKKTLLDADICDQLHDSQLDYTYHHPLLMHILSLKILHTDLITDVTNTTEYKLFGPVQHMIKV